MATRDMLQPNAMASEGIPGMFGLSRETFFLWPVWVEEAGGCILTSGMVHGRGDSDFHWYVLVLRAGPQTQKQWICIACKKRRLGEFQ